MTTTEASLNNAATAAAGGDLSAALRRIRLDEPRQRGLVRAMETLRIRSLGRLPGEACRGLRAIHPTGCGKSEAAKAMVRFVESRPGLVPGSRPVLHVTLDTVGTPKSAVASCLKAYRAGYSTTGSEDDLLERLEVAIEENDTEIIIVDELNHCSGKTMGRDVSNTFKNILTRGWSPIVFLGTSEADALFRNNKELRGRCTIYGDLRPMDSHADASEWAAFAAGMDAEMERLNIVTGPVGMDDPDLAEALCVACGGRIGELVNVLDDGLLLMVSDGRDRLAIADLRDAVQTRFVLDGDIDANPLDDLA